MQILAVPVPLRKKPGIVFFGILPRPQNAFGAKRVLTGQRSSLQSLLCLAPVRGPSKNPMSTGPNTSGVYSLVRQVNPLVSVGDRIMVGLMGAPCVFERREVQSAVVVLGLFCLPSALAHIASHSRFLFG